MDIDHFLFASKKKKEKNSRILNKKVRSACNLKQIRTKKLFKKKKKKNERLRVIKCGSGGSRWV
jgi:hypothetical protein